MKGTLHWVCIDHSVPIQVRLYDRLFQEESPDQDKNVDFKQHLNPNSLSTQNGFAEPSLQSVKAGERFQFQRLGYFVVDPDSSTTQLIFNKTVGLRDNWAKKI